MWFFYKKKNLSLNRNQKVSLDIEIWVVVNGLETSHRSFRGSCKLDKCMIKIMRWRSSFISSSLLCIVCVFYVTFLSYSLHKFSFFIFIVYFCVVFVTVYILEMSVEMFWSTIWDFLLTGDVLIAFLTYFIFFFAQLTYKTY